MEKQMIYSTSLTKKESKKALKELKYSTNAHYSRLAKWKGKTKNNT